MPRQHFTTDAHFEVGDRVLVRGVPACVRMETATQVLIVFDQAQGGQQEEWIPKSSPALKLARNSASLAAQAAAAAAHGAPADPDDEELSSDGEDDECNICGNGGKHTSMSRVPLRQRHSLLPWPLLGRTLQALGRVTSSPAEPLRRPGPHGRLRRGPETRPTSPILRRPTSQADVLRHLPAGVPPALPAPSGRGGFKGDGRPG